ncbi:MAG: cytochrome c biogenesis protein CcdA [Candidatus Gorgyraea atricola]|nr:cytochrome c biogenesis protein CcdA [Candidatus Gorgyraea atricola]
MHKKVIKTILALIFAILIAQPCLARSQKLTIVFTGDMRGELENCHCPKDDFGGLNRRYEYLSEVRKKVDDVLLLDVGDVVSLLTADLKKEDVARNASISFEAMKLMKYDVMNIGESDLVLGESFLRQQEDGLSFPLISANIVDKNTEEPFSKPYIIKTMKNGLRVGIIGLVNERYVLNSKRLDILSNKKTISKYIPELRANSDVIIVLGHLGLPYSIDLAKSVEGIDVILSGHWDAQSQEPMKINDTLVMPTSYHSRKIGRLDLKLYKGKVHSYTWESTPLGEEYDGINVVADISSRLPKSQKIEEMDSVAVGSLLFDRPLKVLVFYTAGCKACMDIEKELLPEIKQKYGDAITLEHLDIGTTKNFEYMTKLENLYGIEGGYVPEVIVSGYVLMGKEEIFSRLDEVIHDALEEDPAILKKNKELALEAAEYHPPTESLILSKFESFSVYTVMAAGLLDGVNPCAFTTIVFFISFLAFVGYRRREMFFAGASFTVAVFIAYLLIGLGIFRFLKILSGFSYVMLAINILIGGLAILLGILSLVDYFRFKKTKDTSSIILKLPESIKKRIHSVIGSDFRGEKHNIAKIIWVAFTAGFMVSILESFCTGQVYLPTIAFVMRMPGKAISAFAYLVLYNLAFILPLIAVFILGLFGATSTTFSKFMQKHLGLVKLSTAVLFFLLGTLLLIFR